MVDLGPQLWINHHGTGEPPRELRSVSPVKDGPSSRKPPWRSGLWTSSLREGENWLAFVATELKGRHAGRPLWRCGFWALDPDPQARVYEIATYFDLAQLAHRYPFNGEAPFRHGVDWHAVGKEWDAVHLTASGQWATRMPPPPSVDLYGWDCESTFWYRWRFTDVRRLTYAEARGCVPASAA